MMLEPVTFPGNRQDAGVVQQAIKQRRRQRGILRKGCIPLPKRQVAGDDQRTPLVAGGNGLPTNGWIASRYAGARRSTRSGRRTAWCTTSRNSRITGTGSRQKEEPPSSGGCRHTRKQERVIDPFRCMKKQNGAEKTCAIFCRKPAWKRVFLQRQRLT